MRALCLLYDPVGRKITGTNLDNQRGKDVMRSAEQPFHNSGNSTSLDNHYLMEEHGLRQSDLPEIGSQGVVSEILNGKR